jgi:broad specificity phosphatase PhoE
LPALYLIRHGQAGTRDDYDLLSALGQAQARELGAHWVAQAFAVDVLLAGGLRRQQLTAQIVSERARAAGVSLPEVVTDSSWNEFNLAAVYRALAPRLCGDDAGFAGDFKAMQAILRNEPHTIGKAVGRCDRAVIRAWMENRYPADEIETWAAFRERVERRMQSMLREDPARIAVFTSATPIALAVGMALDLSHEKLLDLMGALYNTSLTVLKLRGQELRLLSFNTLPHLHDPALHTFR